MFKSYNISSRTAAPDEGEVDSYSGEFYARNYANSFNPPMKLVGDPCT